MKKIVRSIGIALLLWFLGVFLLIDFLEEFGSLGILGFAVFCSLLGALIGAFLRDD